MQRFGGRALWASGILHGALVLAMSLGPRARPRLYPALHLPTPIELVPPLRRPERPAPTTFRPVPGSVLPDSRGGLGSRERSPRPLAGGSPPGAGVAAAPTTAADQKAPAGPPAAPFGEPAVTTAGQRHIDLFSKESLCQAVGCASAGPAGPGHSLEQKLAEDQAQLAAEAAVKKGQVAPVWRELERDLERSFTPSLESASPATRGELIGQQLLRGAQAAPERSRAGWLANRDPGSRVRAEILAAQEAYDEPSEGREAEVEVEVSGDNQVIAVRLVRASGSRRLDEEALRAVRQVVLRRPIVEPPGPLRARFALRAEAAVNLPRVTPAVEDNSGLVSGFTTGIAGTFDEVSRKASLRTPLAKRLKTRVRLISVRRSAPPPEGRSPGQ